MENWIGVGIWIVMGMIIGLFMKVLVKRPEATPGHTTLIAVLGAFAAVVGGMLGVGIFEFNEPLALSAGGMGGAFVLAVFLTWVYRWGIRGFV